MNDNFRNDRREEWAARWNQDHSGGSHVWTGIFLLAIGGLALAKSFGVYIPNWLFSWQMLLIAIGIFIGIKKGFKDGGWFVPIIIGTAFLINEYALMVDMRKHFWPVFLIGMGVVFIFRPKKTRTFNRFCKPGARKPNPETGVMEAEPVPLNDDAAYTSGVADDFVTSTCVFSGAKKIVLSKSFRGGELTNIFGGSEIDLTQADMQAPAIMEVTAIFGGATLIVPANWSVQSDGVSIFGGISDKRKMMVMPDAPKKTLILKGTMIFGGIEIRSY